MEKVNFLAKPSDLEVLSIYELFNPDPIPMGYRIQVTLDKMMNVCDMPHTTRDEEVAYRDQLLEFRDDGDVGAYIAEVRRRSKEAWQKDTVDLLQKEPFENPMKLLRNLLTIPSWSQNRFVAFKIFDWQFREYLGESPESFFEDMIQLPGGDDPTVIILWRRRIIESFVSFQKAIITEAWTTKDKQAGVQVGPVRVKKDELERYIADEKEYYNSVIKILTKLGRKFEVFEYDHDLSDSDKQVETIGRLSGIFGLSPDAIDRQEVIGLVEIRQQSEDRLDEEIENWEEVVQWGYGGKTDEWEDLFANISFQP